jgi:hypothetical protein
MRAAPICGTCVVRRQTRHRHAAAVVQLPARAKIQAMKPQIPTSDFPALGGHNKLTYIQGVL